MIQSKTILVTGATGLIGRSLCAALEARGHTVRRVSRGDSTDYKWNLATQEIDASAMSGVDVVFQLAGESVVQRWTEDVKKRILSSRVDSTKLLVNEILKQVKRPAFISASGISYYGMAREGLVDESGKTGDGFLAEVTRQWEGAAEPLINAGVRSAFFRIGVVLSREGGALAKMLTPFKLGLGGCVGDGQKKMSWIGLPDLVNAFVFAAENDAVEGAINAVAPQPVSNREFTKTLGVVIGRPTIFPMPCGVFKLLLGEMGTETVLSDLGVLPNRLTELGFEWQTPSLSTTLRETIYQD